MLFDLHHIKVPNPKGLKKDELLAAVVDACPDAVISQDLAGTIVTWNKAAILLLGYPAEEAVGQPFTLVARGWTARDFDILVTRLQAGEVIDDYETELRTKGGAAYPVVLNISLLLGSDSEPIGTSAVVKLAAQNQHSNRDLVLLSTELLQSERRFRILSETLADILWSTSASGLTPVYLSPRFEQYTGLPQAAVTEEVWLELVHPDDRPVFGQAWLAARESQQRFQLEYRLRRADGAYRWFVSRGMPVCNNEGEVLQWLGTCTDIDDLKRGEEALRRSNQELKQFAYAAAHDLQEPLRNVATSVGMLRRHYESQLDASGMEWIDASIEGAHRLYAMVKDLLTFSTIIEDETTPADDVSVLSRSAVEAALVELSAEIERVAPDIRIETLPRLAVKSTHAVRLFQNIIGNSLKYRRPDVRSIIEISARPSGNDWTLSVKDNGIGFDSVYAGQIFGVFKRLHGRDTYPGNGIGLAVCERVVAHYGGKIWAEATPGQGSTFYFTLPGLTAKP